MITPRRSAVLTLICLTLPACGWFSKPVPFDRPTDAVHVLTNHNDAARTGANLHEMRLSPATVTTESGFGKLYARKVDGHIYAQPLYVANLVAGKNVVVVATMHNSVYAYDADDPNEKQPLWFRHLEDSIPVDEFGPGYKTIRDEVGIMGTPAIDLDRRTLFVVTTSRSVKDGRSPFDSFAHHLHALDLVSGADRPGSPVQITGRYPGCKQEFASFRHLQRPGLLLSRAVIYFAFASYRDQNPFHGWVFGYDAATLKQVAIYNTTPASLGGGIWQSGTGISADEAGDLYLTSGNGFGTDATVRTERGESVIRLSPGGPQGLTLADYFTPFDWKDLDRRDVDLGSTGVLLVPDGGLAVAGSKGGTLYMSRRQSLGGLVEHDAGLVDKIEPGKDRKPGDWQIYGSPVYWRSGLGRTIYLWPGHARLKALVLGDDDRFGEDPAAQGRIRASRYGGMLSLSANGNDASSGIVWAALPRDPDADDAHQTVPGILRAFDASHPKVELWNSEMAPNGRDSAGSWAKFNPPTIANGKVYLATFSRELVVYGLPAGHGASR